VRVNDGVMKTTAKVAVVSLSRAEFPRFGFPPTLNGETKPYKPDQPARMAITQANLSENHDASALNRPFQKMAGYNDNLTLEDQRSLASYLRWDICSL
jgi:hypothetical protein